MAVEAVAAGVSMMAAARVAMVRKEEVAAAMVEVATTVEAATMGVRWGGAVVMGTRRVRCDLSHIACCRLLWCCSDRKGHSLSCNR